MYVKTRFLPYMKLPDNAVQTADLLIRVDCLIVEVHLLLKRRPALIHSRTCFHQVEESQSVFGPHHCRAPLNRF